MRCWHILYVVEDDAIRRGNVFRAKNHVSSGMSEPAILEQSPDFRVVGHRGESPRVGIPVLAAACSTMQRAEIGIVIRNAPVPA